VGHRVTGVDLDDRKTDLLRQHRSYVEDVTDERVAAAVKSGRFVANSRSSTFDIAIIAVPTPMRGSEPDLSYVESAGRMLGETLSPGGTVVLESTTYPGTTEGLLADALFETSGLRAGEDFHLGYSPERIDPGSTIYTLENTPKLVAATTPEGLTVIARFYDTIVDRTVPVSSPRVAELAKIFENTQANVNIALVNELAGICHELDIDVHEMIDAAMTKGHSMARWTPGPGVGGHCLPVDPMYLAWQTRTHLGRPFQFAELAQQVNNHRPVYVAERSEQLLAAEGLALAGAEVLVLGVAYKANVGDVRESPAIDVVEQLTKRGARVTVVDPHVEEWTLTPTLDIGFLGEHLEEFDLVVVVTDHKAFDWEKIAASARRVLDCRNVMPASSSVAAL
jgi:nucleotide sugar dehydrogenase